jgi:YD repeat-containing protein
MRTSGAVPRQTWAKTKIFNADKSGDVWHYGITGKSFTSDHYVYSAGNVLASVTRLHADGSRDYYEQRNADGSIQQDYYSAAGVITQEVRTGANGAIASTTYDTAGRMIQDISATKVTSTWTYAASGALATKTVFNADKSGDVWHYGITGQSYTSDHYAYSAVTCFRASFASTPTARAIITSSATPTAANCPITIMLPAQSRRRSAPPPMAPSRRRPMTVPAA